jgi:FAD/FMN-containing dehydrogenase
MRENDSLKGLTLCLCLLLPASLGAESLESEKARSGKKFAENIRSGQPASILPVDARASSAGSAGASLSLEDGAKGLQTASVPNPKGGVVDDVSRLNPTPIDSLRLPKTEEDIRKALQYARENHLGLSVAGARHSQGGQIVYDGNVVLDMALFRQMSLDKEKKILTVQSGARWNDVQRLLDGNGLSLDVIQTHVIFSVGGTLSVNAHGSNPDSGPIGSTVKSLRIMLADGSIVNASREENAELFHAALGGYGMVGVILEAQLQLRDNELYTVESDMMKVKDYPEYFAKNVRGNDKIKYLHALLSTAPGSFLEEVSVVKYMDAGQTSNKLPVMDSPKIEELKRKVFAKMFVLAKSKIGQEIFWKLSGSLAPALASHMKFSRNQAMAEPMVAFKSNDPKETQILNEYFLPPARFPEFVERLRESVLKHGATLTMAAARGVAADKDSMLPYAPEDRMALVLFFNQTISKEENENMAAMTRELIGAAIDLGGRFYLPYQLVYSDEQLRKAYPNIDQFFELKRKYDPNEMFMNKWYAKYGKGSGEAK